MDKVSVIVPVYNVEQYLPQCLESIAGALYPNLEIICINDGSTDNSLAVLQQFAAKDPRFVIINQENAGVSAARNRGMQAATGRYLAFVDGDDYIQKDFIAKAVDALQREKADVVLFGVNEINAKNEKISERNLELLKKLSIDPQKMTDQFMLMDCLSSIIDKMFRTDFIKQNHIAFPKGINMTEDGVFCIETFLKGAKFTFLPEYLYNYHLNREGSLTSHTTDCVAEHVRTFYWLEKTPLYQQADFEIQKMIINKYISGCVWLIRKSPKIQRRHILETGKFVLKLQETYDPKIIKRLESYVRFRNLQKQNSLWGRLIKVEKTPNYKTITCGFIKIKIKRRPSK